MLSQEETDRVTVLALSREGRESTTYQSEMEQVTLGLNGLALESVRRFDIHELVQRTGLLIWIEVRGLEQEIPIDISWLPRLRNDLRMGALRQLKPVLEGLTPSIRAIVAQLETANALALLVDFKNFEPEPLIKEVLESLRKKAADLSALTASRKRDLLEECRIEAVRTMMLLHAVEEMVKDSTHPRHKEARTWLTALHYHGDQNLFRREMARLRDLLISQWNEICGRVEGVRASQLEPGQPIWFRLDEEEAALPGQFERQPHDYGTLKTEWSPRIHHGRLKAILEDRYAPQACIQNLASLLLDLEHKLEQAPRNDGPLFNALEFERRSGRISGWQYREELQKLEDNWVALYWLYLDVLTELSQLKGRHSEVQLPDEVEQRLDRFQIEEHDQLPAMPDLSAVAELEASLEDMELEDEYHFNRMIVLYRQWSRQLNLLSPAHHQLKRVTGFSAELYRQMNQQLAHLYRDLQRLDRLGIRLEFFLLEAFDKLNDWSSIDLTYWELYLEIQKRNMTRAVYSGNHRCLRAQKYQEELERAIREPEDLVPRLTVLSRLLSFRPGLAVLVPTLEQEIPSRKRTFLLENSLESEIQTLRIRAEARENLKGTEKRLARLEAFGLCGCNADSYQKQLDQLVLEARTLCQDQQRQELNQRLVLLEENLIRYQRLCLPKSGIFARIQLMIDRSLIPQPLGQALFQDLDLCCRELMMVQEDLNGLTEELRRQHARQQQIPFQSWPVLSAADVDEFCSANLLLENTPLVKLKELAALSAAHQNFISDLFERARQNDVLIANEVRACISERIYRLFKANGSISNMLRLCLLQHSPELAALELRLLMLLLEYSHPEVFKRQKLVVEVMEMFRLKERGTNISEEGLETLWKDFRSALDAWQPQCHSRNYHTNKRYMIQWFEKLFRGTFV